MSATRQHPAFMWIYSVYLLLYLLRSGRSILAEISRQPAGYNTIMTGYPASAGLHVGLSVVQRSPLSRMITIPPRLLVVAQDTTCCLIIALMRLEEHGDDRPPVLPRGDISAMHCAPQIKEGLV
ncbi:hypothetical protein C8F04DRAFT_1072761 [Mycena alexandri]|uniref:Uncharacterized protein n=1 Tax=Mycena alexandri TaxID=1745969 RepID=A0AAD6TEH8_9AGAR|nr:hypothetical protein C8F04DRAFT_1072761 [Mycena alexandri]